MTDQLPNYTGDDGFVREAQPMLDMFSIPAQSLKAVTPNDSADLPDGVCRALYVGGFGDLALIAENDSSEVTLVGVSGWISVRARRVMATNTTATNIVAVY